MPLSTITGFPRLCISSTGGGGGKTLLSIGLGRALVNLNKCVQPFKKGPDYIDAAWLAHACNRPTTNLDPFFLKPQELRSLFLHTMHKCLKTAQNNNTFAIIEGNRGLYDGLDETGFCSTAIVARTLKAPILLCINAEKSTRTIAAILNGIVSFEKNLLFCGVILNRIGSTRHEIAIRRCLETYCDIPVLGAIPRLTENPMPERHMGIASYGNELHDNINSIMNLLAEKVSSNCNIQTIVDRTEKMSTPLSTLKNIANPIEITETASPIKIGYVYDKSLWFYYPENIESLSSYGVKVIKLSLFDHSQLNLNNWNSISGLYLGGGFPEDYANEISQSPFLHFINQFAKNGMPIYAECGGLIILCKEIINSNGKWTMANVFPQTIKWTPKPCGLGYVQAKVISKNPFFPINQHLRGHEFHYSFCETAKTIPHFALELERGIGLYKPNGQKGYDALTYKNVWGAYTHFFSHATPCWAKNFVYAAIQYQNK